jgi:hypothetical protein
MRRIFTRINSERAPMRTRPLRAGAAVASIAAMSWFAALPAHAQSAQSSPSAAPAAPANPGGAAPAPKDVEDPAVTGRAKDALHRVQTGTIDRAQLAEEYNHALTDDTLQKAQTQLGSLGEPAEFAFEGKAVRGNVTAYVYHVKFVQGADLDEMIAFDPTNKIVRMLFSLRHPNGGGGADTPANGAAPAPSPTATST